MKKTCFKGATLLISEQKHNIMSIHTYNNSNNNSTNNMIIL